MENIGLESTADQWNSVLILVVPVSACLTKQPKEHRFLVGNIK